MQKHLRMTDPTFGDVLDAAWKTLHDEIVMRPRNVELLTLYGLSLPRKKSDYAY